jgi:hypothetical protein
MFECVRGDRVDLTELETVLLLEISKITELDICRSYGGPPVMGLPLVLKPWDAVHQQAKPMRLSSLGPRQRQYCSLLAIA